MFHYIVWEVFETENVVFIKNQFLGIQVYYLWNKKNGEFFLFPYYDQNLNTYNYFAFEEISQKKFFDKINKIPGIGPKTAYHISIIEPEILNKAIVDFDVKFFQSIKGVWPKTAKRILIDLKNTITESEIKKLEIDQKLYKDILGSLKPLGYESKKIKKAIETCTIDLKHENLWEIIKRIINNI